MANYCITKYVIEGEKAELDAFEAMLRRLEAMKPEDFPCETGWGSTWLGFVAHALGKNWEEMSTSDVKGSWRGLERRDEGVLALTTESAWASPDELMDIVCARYPSFQLYFYAEEPGCEVFVTNDTEGKYFPGRFWLSGCVPVSKEGDEVEYVDFDEYLVTEQDVMDFIAETLHHPVTSPADVEAWNSELEEASEEEKFGDNWCYINLFQITVC